MSVLPARLQHQRAAEMIRMLPQPLALSSIVQPRRREPVHDQAQRFAGRMRVDCLHAYHCDKP
jgi:hypothetical protein